MSHIPTPKVKKDKKYWKNKAKYWKRAQKKCYRAMLDKMGELAATEDLWRMERDRNLQLRIQVRHKQDGS